MSFFGNSSFKDLRNQKDCERKVYLGLSTTGHTLPRCPGMLALFGRSGLYLQGDPGHPAKFCKQVFRNLEVKASNGGTLLLLCVSVESFFKRGSKFWERLLEQGG